MSNFPALSQQSKRKRSRRRCRHIETFRKRLEERGIRLEEVIGSDQIYCVHDSPGKGAEHTPKPKPDCEEDEPEPDSPDQWKPNQTQLIKTLEKGFDKVGVRLSSLAQENDDLKRGLAQQVGTIGREVAPEYFQWVLNILATGSQRAAAQALGLKRSTFSDRLRRYANRGGVYAFLFGLVKVRSRVLGTRKLEHYNEEYLAHQKPVDGYNEESLLQDLLDALESQNQKNWPKVRQELIDLLKEHIG